MKKLIYIVLAIVIIGAAYAVIKTPKKDVSVACTQEAKICPDGSAVSRGGPMCEFSACPPIATTSLDDIVRVTSPKAGATIISPIKISGEARGTWFFEASAPVSIVDWDGKIIGQGIAQARGDWMTTEFVPFEATVTFIKPVMAGPQSNRGAIILKNDNPSGIASTSKSIEIPIIFQ